MQCQREAGKGKRAYGGAEEVAAVHGGGWLNDAYLALPSVLMKRMSESIS